MQVDQSRICEAGSREREHLKAAQLFQVAQLGFFILIKTGEKDRFDLIKVILRKPSPKERLAIALVEHGSAGSFNCGHRSPLSLNWNDPRA